MRVGTVVAALAVAVGIAATAMPAAASAEAGVYEYGGEVAGCEYTLSVDSGAKSFSGAAAGCAAGALAITSIEGEYAGDSVTLGDVEAEGTIEGRPVALSEYLGGASYTAGVDLDTLFEEIAEGAPEGSAQEAMDRLAAGAVYRVLETALGNVYGKAFGENGIVSSVLASEQEYCDGFSYKPSSHTNDNCAPTTCPKEEECGQVTIRSADVGEANAVSSAGAATRSASRGLRAAATAKETEEGLEELCPVINSDQKKFVFVCLPSYVHGDVSTGSKPLVLLPGGILICLPIGGEYLFDLSTTPTISSSSSIVSLGGVIAGYNVKLKAPDVALAAGATAMINKVTIEGDHLDLGSVDTNDIVGAAEAYSSESDLSKWANAVKNVAQLSLPTGSVFAKPIFEAPVLVSGSQATLTPSADVTVGSSSQVTVAGNGGLGGEGANGIGGKPGGEAPGGAKDEYGGSHGGYGGYDGSYAAQQEDWSVWQERKGRGPTFDNPFAPTLAGNGGSGDSDVGYGASGGGVVRIDAPKALVRIEGRINADGNGLDHRFSGEDTGVAGAGAGGSVYLTAKSLAGGGEISADGGGYCPVCVNGFGGMGGGGRIALIYGEDGEWTGVAHAHGGVDEQFPGLGHNEEFFAGTGGAGTLFTQQAVFDGKGKVTEGKGEFPEGTLTIDGGRPAGAYPPPDGTPIPDAWGGAHRRLVLTGEARAYVLRPSFGEIDVLAGSDLTSEFGDRLIEVTAGALKVDATSRIDMSGRGYAGGPAGYDYASEPEGGAAETAPGQTPALAEYGGSHGGAGGAATGYLHPEYGDRPSSTYDDPAKPSLPGGGGAGGPDTALGNPGGGVLDITAATLQLDGVVSADGEGANGPNEDDPTPFSRGGGAGAGGSVLVHAGQFSGSGIVKANGGWACLTGGPPLLPEGNTCNASGGSGGGGGGGRVAVYATSCGWAGTMEAKGGIDEGAAETGDAQQTTGGDGSVYYADGEGSCSTPGDGPSGGGSSGVPDGGAIGGSGSTGSGGGSGAGVTHRARRLKLSGLKLKGMRLIVRVSAAATIVARLERCHVKRAKKHRKRIVCRTVRRLRARAAKPGRVSIHLPSRVSPGCYHLTVHATDGAGAHAKPLRRKLTIYGSTPQIGVGNHVAARDGASRESSPECGGHR